MTALTATAAITLSSGCSRSTFIQNPYQAIQRSTPEQIAQAHPPKALQADLEAIVALHERTNPNRRLHSTLGYLSPMQYKQRWHEAQRKKGA